MGLANPQNGFFARSRDKTLILRNYPGGSHTRRSSSGRRLSAVSYRRGAGYFSKRRGGPGGKAQLGCGEVADLKARIEGRVPLFFGGFWVAEDGGLKMELPDRSPLIYSRFLDRFR